MERLGIYVAAETDTRMNGVVCAVRAEELVVRKSIDATTLL
jgi:hypothetical protein